MAALLSLQGVSKHFLRGDTCIRVLKDISFEVDEGELVAIVAVRGQGKSTLLRIAAGLEHPDGGRVHFDGRDFAPLGDRELSRLLRCEIGLAGRSGPGVHLEMLEYVAMPLLVHRRRRGRGEAYARALAALDRTGMADRARRQWEALSDCERALVELAQAIVAEPRLLVIDDITDGLSIEDTERVVGVVRRVANDERVAVLMGLADGEPALAARRVHSLSRGELSLISDPARRRGEVRDLAVRRRTAPDAGGR